MCAINPVDKNSGDVLQVNEMKKIYPPHCPERTWTPEFLAEMEELTGKYMDKLLRKAKKNGSPRKNRNNRTN
jgi:ABC-type Fe3+/spermidine/putrescine transport system ATPase subunit